METARHTVAAIEANPARAADLRFRRLEPRDHDDAAGIAFEAFAGDRFYEESVGFDADGFARYWDVFLALALRDRGARVYGAEVAGRPAAILVVAHHGFPTPLRGLGFLMTLLARVGPRRTLAYLRFVAAYDRAMRRPRAHEAREARGLWLMASARATRPRVGAALARFVVEQSREEGKSLCTGFVDAGNAPLLAFYRRAGFRVGPRFPFLGRWAVIVERDEGVRA
jgi:ribosomal protein S18 acetylase RimI-like enzyme